MAAAATPKPESSDGKPAGEETDDSVPLVCSKLAAKLAMDRCTPMNRRPSTGSECSRDTGEDLSLQCAPYTSVQPCY